MRRFDTNEKAKKFLELRRHYAYKKIEKRGDIILLDRSFVGWDFSDIARPVEDRGKSVAYLVIWTKDMVEDIRNMK